MEMRINVVPNNILPKQYSVSNPPPISGNLSKTILSPTLNNIVYTVPSYITYVNCTISIVNDGAMQSIFKLYISSNKVPNRVDLIEPSSMLIVGNGVYIRDNIRLSKNENVIVYTDSENLIVRVDGIENILV